MNATLRRIVLSLSATLLGIGATGVALAAGTLDASASAWSGAPHGSVSPPWEPDHQSVGGLVFYNSAGHVVTSGTITGSPIAAYVEGTNPVRAGDTKATLFGYLPVKGEVPGEFSGEQLGQSTTYPNSSAPSPLDKAKLPVETGHSGDETVAQLEADFPNTDTSTDGYAATYQLRLVTSAKGRQGSTSYDSADIRISGSTWSVVYSATSTTLSVTPAKSAPHGKPVKLAAAVDPSAATGSIQFRDGAKVLKTVALSSGTASFSTTSLPIGTNRLSAVFVPSGSRGFAESTSAAHALKVTGHATATTLRTSKSTIRRGAKLTLTASASPAVGGTFTFYDGTKKLATVKGPKGKATYTTTNLPVGMDSLKATFTPANTGYGSSTSKTVRVKVEK